MVGYTNNAAVIEEMVTSWVRYVEKFRQYLQKAIKTSCTHVSAHILDTKQV